MKIPLSTLAGLYKQVAPVIPKKSPAVILEHALLQIGGGTIKLSGGDSALHAEAWAEFDQPGEFSCCIPIKRLQHLVALDGLVDLSLDGVKLTAKNGRNKFTMPILLARDYPTRTTTRYKLETDIPDLQAQLSRISFAMAFNDIRYYLNGVFFEFTGSELYLVATDGHRAAISKSSNDSEPFSMIVPSAMVKLIEKIPAGRVKADSSEICFETEGFRLVGATILQKYPDWRRTVPKLYDDTPRCTVDRTSLLASISAVRPIISLDAYNSILLKSTESELTMSAAKNSDAETSLQATGSPIDLAINLSYFADMASFARCEMLVLHQCDRALFVSDGNWQSVAMGMRG